ncbi:MAG: hypothetical protein KF797_14675 [Flavobacteriales bacterium]|nr:hypothetical protein [Flavobacteriales bacterium]
MGTTAPKAVTPEDPRSRPSGHFRCNAPSPLEIPELVAHEPRARHVAHDGEAAPKGSFITLYSDVVSDALTLVLKLKEEEDKVDFNKEDIPNRNKELVG